ncbi:ABC transporter permease [Pseudonocardia ailaonensis]|uniref:ABC transporter permease n=1 Tax=Pseudonocardia ailaonensis TaxID=367279 RepID=A0ABN2MIE2_9PSEU
MSTQRSTAGVATAPMRSVGSRLRPWLIDYAMVIVLVAVVAAAQLTYSRFLTIDNLRNLLTQNAQVGIVAAVMTLVLIAGGFDLSVSGTFSLGSVLFAGLCATSGLPVGVALVLVVLAGLGLGLVNGLVITKLGVNAFVATLGTAAAYEALASMYSGSKPISALDVPGFDYFGTAEIAGLPVSVWFLIALYAVASLVLTTTTFGRRLVATGGNGTAARLSGVRVDAIRIGAFMICGAGAAVAGSLLASSLSVGQTGQMPLIALDAIAAVVIGGTSLFGGEGAMWKTAVGVLILATMNNLFSSLAIETPVQNVVKGAVIVAAVAFDGYARRTRA